MNILRKQRDLTVADLKRVIAEWPEVDSQGDPFRIVLSTHSTLGMSSFATAVVSGGAHLKDLRLETGNRPPSGVDEDGLMARTPRDISEVQPDLDSEETRLQVSHYRAELYRLGQLAINCTKSQSKDPAEWRRDLEDIVERTQRFLLT